MPAFQLSGKCASVTDGSRGIGKASALVAATPVGGGVRQLHD